jgi:hypothetical protein
MLPQTRGARVAIALVAALLLTFTVGPASAATRSGSGAPPKWDPKIAALAAKVESLRHLKFDHPVPVDFLSDAAFRKKVGVDRDTLSKTDRADLEREQSQLRAVGLIGHDVDLLEATSSLRQSDVLALYSPKTKRITVRGTDLSDPAIRVTLAHELTHALQDQHFDLTKLGQQAEKTHSSSALTALVEGDAVRVQQLYEDGLSAKEQSDYEDSQRQAARQTHDAASSGSVPEALEAFVESPYEFGPTMLQVVTAEHGSSAVDALFEKPPTTDSSYLTPSTLVDGTKFAKVPVPALAASERQVGKPDTFGSFALYLVLASRLDPVTALQVADGWGGDAMVTFRKHGELCLRARFVGRTTDDAPAIADALRQWSQAMPPGAVEVRGGADDVTMTACDTGQEIATTPDFATAALVVAVNRNGLYSALLEQQYPLPTAECAADRVVSDPVFRPVLAAQIADPSAPVDPALLSDLRTRATALVTECVARHGQAGAV